MPQAGLMEGEDVGTEMYLCLVNVGDFFHSFSICDDDPSLSMLIDPRLMLIDCPFHLYFGRFSIRLLDHPQRYMLHMERCDAKCESPLGTLSVSSSDVGTQH